MNTRETHLQRELRVTEHTITETQTLLNTLVWDTCGQAYLQARVDILERRAQTLRGLLLLSVNRT